MNSVDRNSVRIGRHQAAGSTVPKPLCVSTDEGSCVWKLNLRRRRRATSLILLGISWPVISPDLPAGLENSLISPSLSSPQSLSYLLSVVPSHAVPFLLFITFFISLCLSHHLSSLLFSIPLWPWTIWALTVAFLSKLTRILYIVVTCHHFINHTFKKNLLQEIPCALCQIPLILQGCIFLRVPFEGFTLDLLSESVNLHELSLCTCDVPSLKTDKILQFNYCENLIT